MRPMFSIFNQTNRSSGNFKFQSEGLSKNSILKIFSNLDYFLIRELGMCIILANNQFWKSCPSALLSSNLPSSSLLNHVIGICFRVSFKKMRVSNTFLIIASVANPNRLIKFSIVNHPRNAMRWICFSEPFKNSVSLIASFQFPLPAFSKVFYMRHHLAVFVNVIEKLRNSFLNLDFVVRQRQSLSSRSAFFVFHRLICRLAVGFMAFREPLLFSQNRSKIQSFS